MTPIAIQDVIIVEEEQPEEKSEGGILLPNNEKKPGKGKVISVGAGKFDNNGKLIPMQVKVGMIVHFTPEKFIKYSEKHRSLAIMREADVLFVEGADID